jgi:hypothetical protein
MLVTYNQVADKNLHDLGLQTRPAGEQLLEDADQDVSERRANKGAVEGHLGHARGEVVPVLALVVRNPRREDLLQPRECARGQHLGAQRVGLQLLEVCLDCVSAGSVSLLQRTYREVAIGPSACRELLSKLVRQTLVLAALERGAAGLGDL